MTMKPILEVKDIDKAFVDVYKRQDGGHRRAGGAEPPL